MSDWPDKSIPWCEVPREKCEIMLAKGREMLDDFKDPRKWNGLMVGRHLFAAGKAHEQKLRYDFPGFMHFPINLFS